MRGTNVGLCRFQLNLGASPKSGGLKSQRMICVSMVRQLSTSKAVRSEGEKVGKRPPTLYGGENNRENCSERLLEIFHKFAAFVSRPRTGALYILA